MSLLFKGFACALLLKVFIACIGVLTIQGIYLSVLVIDVLTIQGIYLRVFVIDVLTNQGIEHSLMSLLFKLFTSLMSLLFKVFT